MDPNHDVEPAASPAGRVAHDLRGVIGTLKLAVALLGRSGDDATRELAQGILERQVELLQEIARQVDTLG